MFLFFCASLFKKGFVAEDSTFYGVLGIISVVGVVVCPQLLEKHCF